MKTDRIFRLTRKNLKIARWLADPSAWKGVVKGPKVLINSVPKCGTNLLQEVVQALPSMRGTFQRTAYGEVDEKALQFARSIRAGSCATAHLYYSDELTEQMRANHVHSLHLVRDFRDALYSSVKFIEKLDRSHRHGKLFDNAENFDEKLHMCLYGVEGTITGWLTLMEKFDGWRNSDALVIRYEDLLQGNSEEQARIATSEIHRIANALGIENVDTAKIFKRAHDPKGLTFNDPGVEKWRTIYNPDQLKLVNRELGPYLAAFGYEV